MIGYSGSFVSDVERGGRLATRDFALACDRVFDTPGTFERWQEVAKRGAYHSFFAQVLPFERATANRRPGQVSVLPATQARRGPAAYRRPYHAPQIVSTDTPAPTRPSDAIEPMRTAVPSPQGANSNQRSPHSVIELEE
jgi:hypothetical protein